MNKTMYGNPGFTLIELLVVIAIIGVLSSIMLPAVMKGMERGRMGVCSSNLKQIGVALLSYANDNDGRLPWATAFWDLYPNNEGDGQIDSSFIGLKLEPYCKHRNGNRLDLWRCPSVPDSLNSDDVGLRNSAYYYSFFCPLDDINSIAYKKIPSIQYENYLTYKYISGVSIDGPYDFTINWIRPGNQDDWLNWRDTPQVQIPVVWDQRVLRVSEHPSGYKQYVQSAPHFNGALILFLDGHVKWYLDPYTNTDVFIPVE